MQAITTIGLNIAKSVFQVHGVDAAEVVVRRRLKRRLQKLPRCLVGIEKRSNGTSGTQSSPHPQGRQPRARRAPSARMTTECSGDEIYIREVRTSVKLSLDRP
jgi:hypothetical protein